MTTNRNKNTLIDSFRWTLIDSFQWNHRFDSRQVFLEKREIKKCTRCIKGWLFTEIRFNSFVFQWW